VQVKQGILHLNNTPVNRRLIGTVQPSNLQSTADTVYRETLPDGREHMIQEVNDIQLFDNTQAFTIPEGHYFMMGDNRDNSRDSRSSSVGVVPIENFIGKAQFIFFSVDQSARIWEIWKWPTSVRFSRIGSSIE
jgi:signal peptidase I